MKTKTRKPAPTPDPELPPLTPGLTQVELLQVRRIVFHLLGRDPGLSSVTLHAYKDRNDTDELPRVSVAGTRERDGMSIMESADYISD